VLWLPDVVAGVLATCVPEKAMNLRRVRVMQRLSCGYVQEQKGANELARHGDEVVTNATGYSSENAGRSRSLHLFVAVGPVGG
jgi:hypothetical protein